MPAEHQRGAWVGGQCSCLGRAPVAEETKAALVDPGQQDRAGLWRAVGVHGGQDHGVRQRRSGRVRLLAPAEKPRQRIGPGGATGPGLPLRRRGRQPGVQLRQEVLAGPPGLSLRAHAGVGQDPPRLLVRGDPVVQPAQVSVDHLPPRPPGAVEHLGDRRQVHPEALGELDEREPAQFVPAVPTPAPDPLGRPHHPRSVDIPTPMVSAPPGAPPRRSAADPPRLQLVLKPA